VTIDAFLRHNREERMKTAPFALSSVVVAALGTVLFGAPAGAQYIGLKTVPLAAGEQFLIFPASNLGMGAVSIVLEDPLLDPFSNPARGARSTGSRFFSAPTSYTVSNDNGGARTMPVGVQLSGERWFGGVLVALQDLDQGRALARWLPPMVEDAPPVPRADALAVRSTTNRFAHLSLGRRFGEQWAVAASAMFVDLNGTDGVEQLFANAWDIEESGGVRDYRIGLLGSLAGGRSVEASVVYNHYRMTHDVTSVTWELTDSVLWLFTPSVEQEAHRNISKTWGAQVRYVQPIEGTPWRAGGIFTVNRKDHPKIPTYDLTAVEIATRPPIPRDPGNSWAFNVGGGMAYEEGPTTFAVDVVYEPAVSDTWADDVVDVIAADGRIIPPGGHTVDNHFEFHNAHAGMGLSREIGERWAVQLGVRMRSYSYRMEQEDYVLGLDRSLTQQWTEWTPTWGARFETEGIEVRYTGLASSASHFPFPSLSFGGRDEVFATPDAGGDVLAPPTGLLATPDETVVTHRIQISVPIR
jgi:hypothetical protein